MTGTTSAWELLHDTLAAAGCELVAGVPADEPGLLDVAASADGGLLAVPARDQRSAACIAAGYASVRGRPAVVAVTTGPAFGNSVAALAEAASLCLPLVVVTTSVAATEVDRGGFQELPQRALVERLVSWYHRVERADDLAWAARRAVHLAVNGRPGVTVVEVAHEVATADAGEDEAAAVPVRRLRSVPSDDDLRRAAAVLAEAEAPLVVAGGGARAARAGEAVLRLAERLGAAVTTTSTGRGTVPEDHPLACGLVGLYATPPVDGLLNDADVVVAVGTRLEETARMGWPGLLDTRVVHVDCDPAAFDRPVRAEVPLLGDAALTVARLAELADGSAQPDRRDWRERVAASREEALREYLADDAGSPVRQALRAVDRAFGGDALLVLENGLHDIWAYHWPLLRVRGGAVVAPGEQTMMGFGLPAAVGAGLADRTRPVVLISGDGAFGMNLSALATAREHGVGITAVVFDDDGFGWPRLGRREAGVDERPTRFEAKIPYDEIVRALGGYAARLDDPDDLDDGIGRARACAEAGLPGLVVVPVPDDDVPVGVRRVFAEPHAVGSEAP